MKNCSKQISLMYLYSEKMFKAPVRIFNFDNFNNAINTETHITRATFCYPENQIYANRSSRASEPARRIELRNDFRPEKT